MCRYARTYKKHHACFACRKAFKRRPVTEWPRRLQPPEGQPDLAPCPQCNRPMADMGLDFKPPRQDDSEHWEVVEFLYRRGVAYHSCGCNGPGYRPSRWSEVESFLAAHRCRSAAEALLETFGARR